MVRNTVHKMLVILFKLECNKTFKELFQRGKGRFDSLVHFFFFHLCISLGVGTLLFTLGPLRLHLCKSSNVARIVTLPSSST